MTSATPSASPARDPHNDPSAPTRALRWMADVMLLHALCARTACRRAQACRGKPRECLARYAPLVPDEARDGVKAMIEGHARKLAFDEVRDEASEVDELMEWQERVHAGAARGKALRQRQHVTRRAQQAKRMAPSTGRPR